MGGIAPNAFLKKTDFEKEKGFLKPDKYLRVAENIFAIGDCAVIYSKKGTVLPPTAQTAEQCGEYVAKYIMGEKKEFNGKIYGMFCAVGGKYAIGRIGKINSIGYTAYIIKKTITYLYTLGIKTGNKNKSQQRV